MAHDLSPLIFIDSQVNHYQHLVAELGSHALIRVVAANEDGVAAITNGVKQQASHHAIVIVAHGAPGQLYLGNSVLELATLDRYASQIQTWFAPHHPAPELHLYGCNVAAGDAGAEFLAQLHHLTGAGIAASPRRVGHPDLGGDWQLDTTLGQVVHQPLVRSAFVTRYRQVLGADNLANATVWTPINNTGNTTGATHEPGEPIHDPNVSGINQTLQESFNNSIWWQWTAPTTGKVTADTLGSALSNTVLAVYTGGAVNSLNQVAFNDNISSSESRSRVTFDAVAGVTYYFAVDGVGSNTGTVQLNLNTAPQITPNQSFNVAENSSSGVIIGTVQANEPSLTWSIIAGNPDNDSDGNRAFSINTSTGAITVNDTGDLDFEAFAPSYNLLVRATDSGGLFSEQMVTINLLDGPDTPVINALTTSQSVINEGSQLSLSGSFNDPDVDDLHTVTIDWGDGRVDVISNDNLSVADVNGNKSFTNIRHTYQDNNQYTITVTVRDADGLESSRTTGVVVNNVPPVITEGSSLSLSVNEDNATNFTLNATDPGRVDVLTWSILNPPANGTASVSTSPTGKTQVISYTPVGNFAGSDSFEVQVQDDDGGFDTIVVNVTVVPQPDPPSNLNITGNVDSLNEGDIFTLSGSFSDPDGGDSFTVTINWGDGSPATVVPNSSITALGNGNYSFSTTHTYRADSGAGTFSISALVRDSAGLTISDTLSLPVLNVAPTIVQGSFLALTTLEDSPLALNLNATDPADTTFLWSMLSGPSNGAISFNTNPNGPAAQTVIYTPNANFDDFDSFTIQVSDGNGGFTAINVLVDMIPVNDAPASLTLTPSLTVVNEGSSFTLTGSFIDVDTGDSHTITLNWGDGTVLTLTTADLGAPVNGLYTLPSQTHTYADDGNYTITLTVEDAAGATANTTQAITVNNVAPIITNAAGVALADILTINDGLEDTPITLQLRANDPGLNDVLRWSITNSPSHGTVTLLPPVEGEPQEFVYTPNLNYFGTDSFTIRVDDGDGGFDTLVVNVLLNQVNDPPQLTANQFTITEGQPLLITQANLNATDVETFNPDLRFIITGLAAGERFAVVGGIDNTFTLGDVILERVTFIDNGDGIPPNFTITVRDNSGSPTGDTTVLANITFIPVNDAPVIVTSAFDVTEGRVTLLSPANLSATDEESPDRDLTYTITALTGGVIRVNGQPTMTFTQGNIDDGQVVFAHDGSETVPTLTFTVRDGERSTPGTAVINYTSVNDPPRLLANTLSITEGTTVPITLQNIDATDVDNNDNALLFTVSDLDSTIGEFQLRNPDTGVFTTTTTFTRLDIINNQVRFVHKGLEAAPAYTLTVSDGSLTDSGSATVVFTAVNDPPIFVNNVLTLLEGEDRLLSSANISATDEETTDPAGLTFTVSNLSGGQFELETNRGVAINSFTQDDINNSRVYFVHNGSELPPTYTLTVSDGVNAVSSQPTIIFTNVNDLPVLVNNRLAITEDQSRLITTADIDATDVEDNDNTLTFTVGQVVNGVFVAAADFAGGEFQRRNLSGTFVKTDSFTRADIINQRVQFIHDGTNTSPVYAIQVTDSAGDSTFNLATVTFTPVNDLPIVLENRLVLTEGGVFVFNENPADLDLVATDEETPDGLIGYTVTSVTAGQFENVAQPGVAITTFTQQQLNDRNIRFVHDNSDDAPTYVLSVSDGTGGVVTSIGNIDFTFINNPPSFLANTLTLTEGDTVVLTAANLNASDRETQDANLRFEIRSVAGGRFEFINGTVIADRNGSYLSFTLQDVILERVRFVQPPEDEEIRPTYTIAVIDDSIPPLETVQDGVVNFTPVNDAPTILVNTLTISERDPLFTNNEHIALFGDGLTGPATGGILRSADPETPAAFLQYTVSDVVGGRFEFVSTPGVAIFAFSQAQITTNAVRFVKDDTSTVPSYTITVRDAQGLTAAGTPTVTFTDVNDPPAITRNVLTITEGQTLILSEANIQYSDEESDPAAITYTITNLVGGQFEPVANPGVAILTFTQADILAGAIQFVQDGTETPPAYTLTLTDGGGFSDTTPKTDTSNAQVAFTRVNDLPEIAANQLTIQEEATVILTSLNLSVTDEETPDRDLIYTVLNVTHGQFARISAPTVAITTFTQGDLDDRLIQFSHNPASGETPPTYTLRVTDNEGGFINFDGEITFNRINDAPVITVNRLTITEDTTVILASTDLSTTDEEDGPESLTFTLVGGVAGGQFEQVSDPGVAITSFTQADINAGAIQFVQDSTETVPAYTLQVTDSEGGTTTLAATVDFTSVNDLPIFSTNSLTIDENATVILDSTNLFTEDEESPDGELTYTVQSVTNGQFEWVANPGVAITSFTQAQVNAGEVQFAHDASSEDPPTYSLTVTDGDGATVNLPATINFTNVNDPPTFVASTLQVTEGATVVLTLGNLSATDPDHNDADLRYAIGNVSGGSFFLAGQPLLPTDTFTRVELALGPISFVDDGDGQPPTFQFTAIDPEGAATTIDATVQFIPVNDMPVLNVNTFNITEGGTLVITAANLSASDEETEDSQLRYRIRNQVGGKFLNISGDEITTFTQAQVNAGNEILFRHNGSETVPSFTIEVLDAQDGTTGSLPAVINYTPVNDAPVFERNVLSIQEGETVVLSTDNIAISDIDTPLSQMVFTITSVDNGFFTLTVPGLPAVELNAGETFTRTQLVFGEVSFTASADGRTPAYTLTVSDQDPVNPQTASLSATVTFTPINDAPIVTVNAFTITEGQNVAITSASLNATDEETLNPAQLTYTVSNVVGGTFFNVITGFDVLSFTQAQVNAGNEIFFRHNGSETPASFTLTLRDPNGGETVVPGNVTYIPVNDPPVITTNSFPIVEGETLQLAIANLNATDSDNPSTQITYTVSGITGGEFGRDTSLNGVPDALGITTFTQQDVINGRIFFIHDGSNNAPTFAIGAQDLEATLAVVPANIIFTNVNNPPSNLLFSLSETTLNEGSGVILTGTFFDPDSTLHTVTINWGDNTSTTVNSTEVINNGGGNFSLPDVSKVYGDDGIFVITVTVDDGEAEAQQILNITVQDVPPIVPLSGSGPIEADMLYTLTIGTPIDPGNDVLVSFEIDWGDGSTTTVTEPSEVSKVYKVFGDYTITVNATEDSGQIFNVGTLNAEILYPVTDITGNGNTDLFWRLTTGTTTALWSLDSSGQFSASAAPPTLSSGFQVQTIADFNNNDISDVFWRNSQTGENRIWLMNGSTVASTLTLAAVSPDWKIDGFADFNNDGSQDILWRNATSGNTRLWTLQEGVLVSSIALPSVSAGFSAAAISDFNGDGFDDILWRNQNTGQNTVWLMNGTSYSGQSLPLTQTNPQFEVVAVNDFNGDQTNDLLWRNSLSGANQLWLMGNNGAFTSVALPTLDSAFTLVGATDVNGDNQPDLLWRNGTTGENRLWLMNGSTLASEVNLPSQPQGWEVYV